MLLNYWLYGTSEGGYYLLLPFPTESEWEPQGGFLHQHEGITLEPDSTAHTYPWLFSQGYI